MGMGFIDIIRSWILSEGGGGWGGGMGYRKNRSSMGAGIRGLGGEDTAHLCSLGLRKDALV